MEKLAKEPIPLPTPEKESNGLPEVVLPHPGRNDTDFAEDVVDHLPDNSLFYKDGFPVELNDDDSLGKDEDALIKPFGITTSKFSIMSSLRFATWVEQFMNIGKVNNQGIFMAETMDDIIARRMLAGVTFQMELSRIRRILDVAIPIRTDKGDIIYPVKGYNKNLQLYCDPRSPVIQRLDYERAKEIILKEVYGEFCFKDEQSKTHAVARLITPYLRGIMGFHQKSPLWWFGGNRPGCGKDYCNGCSQLVYLGRAFEDAPIGESSEETRKRITAMLVAGRRMAYFANCQHHLSDPTFLTAITDSVFRTRMLGTTSAASDLELANETEYALSGNTGITCIEDYERRLRKILLEAYEEDINSRQFNRSDLWGWIVDNRSLILSAIHTLFLYWIEKGQPLGKTPFASFSVWAEIVGGVMVCNELGDPCLPHQDDDQYGGDLKTRAMTALYEMMYRDFPDTWVSKEQIYQRITIGKRGTMGLNGDDRLDWFGDLENDMKSRVKTGLALKAFKKRILSGIRMGVDESERADRNKYRFVLAA
jgi:hypothetical protein